MSFGTNYVRGTFNIGTNLASISVIDNDTGQAIDIGLVTEFTADEQVQEVTSRPITNRGYNQTVQEFNGWTGSMMIDRRNGALTDLMALMEQNYHDGQPQKYFTIVCTIQNTNFDGSTDTYQFNYCTLRTNFGTWRKDQAVQQKVTFTAQDMVAL